MFPVPAYLALELDLFVVAVRHVPLCQAGLASIPKITMVSFGGSECRNFGMLGIRVGNVQGRISGKCMRAHVTDKRGSARREEHTAGSVSR